MFQGNKLSDEEGEALQAAVTARNSNNTGAEWQ